MFDLKRTQENLACYALPCGGWFPQVRLVALVECGSLAVIDAAHDSIAIGERELAGRMLGSLSSGTLVRADRGFPSYELYTAAAETGADLAWRISASFAQPVKERLPDGTYLSELRGQRKAERVTVRVIEFSVNDTETGISEVFALITTLTDHERHDAEQLKQLARLYLARWRAETLIEISRIEIRGTHATFRSKSPILQITVIARVPPPLQTIYACSRTITSAWHALR